VGFSPSKQRQAEDRAFRIGQTRDVLVLTLVAQGTIEETMLYRQLVKEWEARLLVDGVSNDAFLHHDDIFGEASLWHFRPRGMFDTFREQWLQLRQRSILAPDASLPNLSIGPVQFSLYGELLDALLRQDCVAAWLDLHVVEQRGNADASPGAKAPLTLMSAVKRPRLFSAPVGGLFSPSPKLPRPAAWHACAAHGWTAAAVQTASTSTPEKAVASQTDALQAKQCSATMDPCEGNLRSTGAQLEPCVPGLLSTETSLHTTAVDADEDSEAAVNVPIAAATATVISTTVATGQHSQGGVQGCSVVSHPLWPSVKVHF
jgi:hypothetical protein